jgi:hypothetical protein
MRVVRADRSRGADHRNAPRSGTTSCFSIGRCEGSVGYDRQNSLDRKVLPCEFEELHASSRSSFEELSELLDQSAQGHGTNPLARECAAGAAEQVARVALTN